MVSEVGRVGVGGIGAVACDRTFRICHDRMMFLEMRIAQRWFLGGSPERSSLCKVLAGNKISPFKEVGLPQILPGQRPGEFTLRKPCVHGGLIKGAAGRLRVG
jgi:hypothetical protein